MIGKWSEKSAKLLFFVISFGAGYLILKYMLGALLPFIFAFFISFIIENISSRYFKNIGINKRILSVIILLVFLLFVGVSLYFIGGGILRESRAALDMLKSDGSSEELIKKCENIWNTLLTKLHIDGEQGEASGESFEKLLKTVFSSALPRVTSFLGSVLRVTPYFIIIPLVTLISCFYFALDHDKITNFLNRTGTRIWKDKYARTKKMIGDAFLRYIRAYAIIFLVTFMESAVGLMILDRPYATLIALFISAVDIFPILGIGTVFVPWSVISFTLGNVRLGTGLIILYGTMTIVRQIIEPKLIGDSVGVHPLAMIMVMFVSSSLFGVTGVVIAPFISIVLRELTRSYQ